MDKIIEVKNVSMRFNLAKERVDNLKEYIVKKIKLQSMSFDEFWALRNISFNIKKAEHFTEVEEGAIWQ